MSIAKTSFTRNLRGYLSTARIGGAFGSGRLTRTTKSLSDNPVEPIDAVFSTIPESYESPTHLTGFQSITQHLLASDVLDNLLQMQNEISSFDKPVVSEPEGPNAKAARAYQHTSENFPEPPGATIIYFGS
jgi:hypothetical protein